MRPERNEGRVLDQRLRERLGADPAAVERLVRRALDSGVRARRPVRWLAATVAATLLLVALLAVLLVRGPEQPAPQRARLSMVSVGELIVARGGRGGGHMLRSGGAVEADGTWQGQIMILRRERR